VNASSLSLLFGTVIALGSPLAANATVSEALNWARVSGCSAAAPRGVPRAPLRESSTLRQVAARLAAGDSLHAALARASYSADNSSAVHLRGAVSDSQVASILASRYCATMIDAHYKEFGVERRANELWIVLAAPLAVPTVADAAGVDRQILDLINAARARGRRCGAKYYPPVAPLVFNPALSDAALEHSRDMARTGNFDHRGHDGSSPSVRVQGAGYAARVVGENIAAGAMTPAEAAQGWLASAPHCENIMDPRFTETGIAFAVNKAARYTLYWTQDFAEPRQLHSAAANAGR